MSTIRTSQRLLPPIAAILLCPTVLPRKYFTNLTYRPTLLHLLVQPRFPSIYPRTCLQNIQCHIPRGMATSQLTMLRMVGLGLDLKVNSILQWVFPQPAFPTYGPLVNPDIGSTATAPALERDGHGRVPRDGGSAPARMDTSQDGMVRLNDRTISHYYGCYWEHFHPLCPIVHYATFMSTDRPPQLARIILAIGAQFSPEYLASSHSMSFFQVSLQSSAPVSPPGLVKRMRF